MWSSRVENKQIALLDLNVLSSLGPNGGLLQRCQHGVSSFILERMDVMFQLSHAEKYKADW